MVTVICDNCAITSEFELVRNALYCASPSSLYLCDCIPCTMFWMSSIASWCSYGGGGGASWMFCICTVTVYLPFPEVVTALFCSWCARWKSTCNFPTSWGRRIVVSTIECRCWTPQSVPKGWSLWKSSWSWILSGLLLAQILSPFTTVQPCGQGVTRGRRTL